MLITPKARKTGSLDCRLDGRIPMMHNQTPITQTRLISAEDRRRMTRTMRGILKNGITTAQIMPNILTTVSIVLGWLQK